MKLNIRVALFFLVIFALIFESSAYANHPYTPKRHIVDTHSDSEHEHFCVDTKESSVSVTTAYQNLKDILYSRNYDGLAGDKIYLVSNGYNEQCSDISSQYIDIYDLRYYIESNTSPRCDGTSSCIVRYGATTQPDGHTHYTHAIITIRETTWNNVKDYIVNHETGHFVALMDGSGSSDCPGSIMHSKDYGCSNGYPANPYQIDLNTAASEANSN